MTVYNACVISTQLYPPYPGPIMERQCPTLRSCLVLAFPVYKYTLLRQRRLRWLGHVNRMNDGRISKDILYRELA